MTLIQFISEHESEIDAHIYQFNQNLYLDYEERQMWVLCDNELREWAIELGVKAEEMGALS